MKKQGSGLDIDLGNHCSKIAFQWAKKTFDNRKDKPGSPCLDVEGAFSNIMDFGGMRLGISSDGIGTKIELAERTGVYNTLGFDLVAMVADDLITSGIEPVNFSNILDVDFLDADIVDSLMSGLHDACNHAGITITGGEIAELGNRIGGYGDKMHFNWCATGIGLLPEGAEPIDGTKIEQGDAVISFRSRGFRSNGFSLLRKIMQYEFGDQWHDVPYDADTTWGRILLTPSLIYTPLIMRLLQKGYNIRGIVHITGGGIEDNFMRILEATGCGAVLDKLHPPLDVMRRAQELGHVTDEQAYRLWNMGNGMLIVLPVADCQDVIEQAGNTGYQAVVAGHITKEPGIVLKLDD